MPSSRRTKRRPSAAEAGLTLHAVTLAAYAETEVRFNRIEQRRAWVGLRLDRALADLPESLPSSKPHRHEVMTLIDDLERALAPTAPPALDVSSARTPTAGVVIAGPP